MINIPRVGPRHDITNADTEWADWRLYEHNVAKTGYDDWKALGFVMRDDAAAIVGVAFGYSWANTAELKHMWVAEAQRGRGFARTLLEAFIAGAKVRGISRIWAATYDFQAPKMYEKFGFVGSSKLRDFGRAFLDAIASHKV